ncbi:MAG: helix-turn-helix domain-containing protein [Oleispira sp.]|nr:helix-turn-helix domain-containing protein [Oleispira sp.]MBL4880577.1 helix-turn-helix domain-containing protein [Oleispira sp.]
MTGKNTLSDVNTAKLVTELMRRMLEMEKKLSLAQTATNLESIENINQIVLKHRKSQNLSQTDLADLSGIGYSVVNKLESTLGHPSIKMATLLQITTALGLKVWVG